MDLDRLSPPDKIVAGAGIVLIVDLVFLPWHSVDLGVAAWSRAAIESPNRLWGVLAVVLAVGVVAVTLLRALRPDTALPDLPVTWDRLALLAAAAALGLLALKLVLNPDALGIGAWLGILLAAAMTSGGYLKVRSEAGATLRNRGEPRNC